MRQHHTNPLAPVRQRQMLPARRQIGRACLRHLAVLRFFHHHGARATEPGRQQRRKRRGHVLNNKHRHWQRRGQHAKNLLEGQGPARRHANHQSRHRRRWQGQLARPPQRGGCRCLAHRGRRLPVRAACLGRGRLEPQRAGAPLRQAQNLGHEFCL